MKDLHVVQVSPSYRTPAQVNLDLTIAVLSFLLSDNALFLRDALINELLDTMDEVGFPGFPYIATLLLAPAVFPTSPSFWSSAWQLRCSRHLAQGVEGKLRVCWNIPHFLVLQHGVRLWDRRWWSWSPSFSAGSVRSARAPPRGATEPLLPRKLALLLLTCSSDRYPHCICHLLLYACFFFVVAHHDNQLGAASYNFASAATRGLLPRSKEVSTQKKLDAVWGVVQQIVEVRSRGCTVHAFSEGLSLLFSVQCIISSTLFPFFGPNRLLRKGAAPFQLCTSMEHTASRTSQASMVTSAPTLVFISLCRSQNNAAKENQAGGGGGLGAGYPQLRSLFTLMSDVLGDPKKRQQLGPVLDQLGEFAREVG